MYNKRCANMREDGKCIIKHDLSAVSTENLIQELEKRPFVMRTDYAPNSNHHDNIEFDIPSGRKLTRLLIIR